MKLYRFLAVALVAATVFSCKKENKKETEKEVVKSEVDGYQLAKEIADEQYSVEIYTLSGKFKKGYNDLFVRVKNKTGNTYEKAAQVTITPVMDMGTMHHSCPVSSFDKMTSKMYVYSGFAIFQMASMTADDWKLSVRLIVNNQSIDLDGTITVDNVSKVNVTAFTGTDNAKYVLALVDPVQPKVGLNVISARLFQMENMMTFTEKNNYKIKIDPRMPSMGNHGSPNSRCCAGRRARSMAATPSAAWSASPPSGRARRWRPRARCSSATTIPAASPDRSRARSSRAW